MGFKSFNFQKVISELCWKCRWSFETFTQPLITPKIRSGEKLNLEISETLQTLRSFSFLSKLITLVADNINTDRIKRLSIILKYFFRDL